MDKQIDDGGPAFPTISIKCERDGDAWSYNPSTQDGMTLRDYFAAQAMTSMLANGELPAEAEGNGWAWYSVAAYRMADAMLRARKVPA